MQAMQALCKWMHSYTHSHSYNYDVHQCRNNKERNAAIGSTYGGPMTTKISTVSWSKLWCEWSSFVWLRFPSARFWGAARAPTLFRLDKVFQVNFADRGLFLHQNYFCLKQQKPLKRGTDVVQMYTLHIYILYTLQYVHYAVTMVISILARQMVYS